MSLSLTLTEAIDKVINNFIDKVSSKYNVDSNELLSLWTGGEVKESTKKVELKSPSPINKKSTAVDPDVLLKCNKAELVAMCKTHGRKCSGTKSDLISRLLGKEDGIKVSTPVSKKNKSSKVKEDLIKATPVVKKLTANIPNILIRRNKWNNFEHPETKFVFDNDTKIVIGKQNENDKDISPLTEDDIDKCNAFKFKFNIPSDLDYKSTLDEVKVDELSEDEMEMEMEIEEEEEEEELNEEDLLDDDLLGDEDDIEDYVSEDEE
jgi:hypothetical protein